jgi:hypothetical protein
MSRLAVEPTQHPIQWVSRIKQPDCKVEYSPPFSAEVKHAWRFTFILPHLNGITLKHRDNFIFTFTDAFKKSIPTY